MSRRVDGAGFLSQLAVVEESGDDTIHGLSGQSGSPDVKLHADLQIAAQCFPWSPAWQPVVSPVGLIYLTRCAPVSNPFGVIIFPLKQQLRRRIGWTCAPKSNRIPNRVAL